MTRSNSIEVKHLLNKHESDCVRLLASGKNTIEIAIEKRRSEFSINLYLRNARKKLQARNNAQAIALAYAAGILNEN